MFLFCIVGVWLAFSLATMWLLVRYGKSLPLQSDAAAVAVLVLLFPAICLGAAISGTLELAGLRRHS